jgi:hypothetical protein
MFGACRQNSRDRTIAVGLASNYGATSLRSRSSQSNSDPPTENSDEVIRASTCGPHVLNGDDLFALVEPDIDRDRTVRKPVPSPVHPAPAATIPAACRALAFSRCVPSASHGTRGAEPRPHLDSSGGRQTRAAHTRGTFPFASLARRSAP